VRLAPLAVDLSVDMDRLQRARGNVSLRLSENAELEEKD